ncbi:MAG: hypothetical protein WAT09_13240 [Paracoccaceae bacterium]
MLVQTLFMVWRESVEALLVIGILSAGADAVGGLLPVMSAILGGFALALATYGVLQPGPRWRSWRLFFRVIGILLLLLACQMFTSGAEKLIDLGVLPFTDPLWDTSWRLNDMGRWGGLVVWLRYWGRRGKTVAQTARAGRTTGIDYAPRHRAGAMQAFTCAPWWRCAP